MLPSHPVISRASLPLRSIASFALLTLGCNNTQEAYITAAQAGDGTAEETVGDEAGSGETTTTSTSGPGTTGNPPTSTSTTSTTSTTTSETTSESTDDTSTTGNNAEIPPPLGQTCHGYATRYWDCCKMHCGWSANVPGGVSPLQTCNANDQSHGGNYGVQNSCEGPQQNNGYTCFSMAPWAVADNLSYGFAAVPLQGDICGRCYVLVFDGGANSGTDPGAQALAGKAMIVQATNLGFDVQGGQFDVLIPGGGVGAFNACSYQWGSNSLGAQYGGFLQECKQQLGFQGTLQQNKDCVRNKCDQIFADPQLAELREGCDWFINWFQAADNPTAEYYETACPQAIIDVSGVDRRPLNDVRSSCG